MRHGHIYKGDVVVIPFPFSDLSATKRRPALVIASLPGDDVILCQITSRTVANSNAIPITAIDFFRMVVCIKIAMFAQIACLPRIATSLRTVLGA
jgi:PemK-like, MazF-like toxin of type II toxin-antitoxin system